LKEKGGPGADHCKKKKMRPELEGARKERPTAKNVSGGQGTHRLSRAWQRHGRQRRKARFREPRRWEKKPTTMPEKDHISQVEIFERVSRSEQRKAKNHTRTGTSDYGRGKLSYHRTGKAAESGNKQAIKRGRPIGTDHMFSNKAA